MLQNKDFLLINVHIPFAGNIPGTDYFIHFDKIADNKHLLPKNKYAKIVVYCRSGYMRALATKDIINLGYAQVYDLQGGMNAWRDARFTQITKKRAGTMVKIRK